MGAKFHLEAFRVLGLRYPAAAVPGFERVKAYYWGVYVPLASRCYWAWREQGRVPQELVGEVKKRVAQYYYKALLDPQSQLFLFRDVAKQPRPRRKVLKLPMVTWVDYRTGGAYFASDFSELRVRLGRELGTLRLSLSASAREWLRRRLAERPDASATAKVFVRNDELRVQLVLRWRGCVELDPKNCIIAAVDVNSTRGLVVGAYDPDGRLQTWVLKPPSGGPSERAAARLQSLAAKMPHHPRAGIWRAIARSTKSKQWRRKRAWAFSACSRIREALLDFARGKPILVLVDAPDAGSLSGTELQRTLLDAARLLENHLEWYGIPAVERRLYSRYCPICSSLRPRRLVKMELAARTGRMRVMRCPRCGLTMDRDRVPLLWAVRIYHGRRAAAEAALKLRRNLGL